jgi:hypothetical protein
MGDRLDQGDDRADEHDEHDRVLHLRPRVELLDRVERGVAEDAAIEQAAASADPA